MISHRDNHRRLAIIQPDGDLPLRMAAIAKQLKSGGKLDASEVHHLRTSIKRARAQLKGIKCSGEHKLAIKKLRNSLRLLAHSLAANRDNHVAHTYLRQKRNECSKEMTNPIDWAIDTINKSSQTHSEYDNILKLITKAESHLSSTPPLHYSPDQFQKKLQKRLISMPQQGILLLQKHSPESLHSFRKLLKTFYYQLELCTDQYQKENIPFRTEIKNLERNLGKLHDLFVIENKLFRTKTLKTTRDMSLFIEEIHHEQGQLLADCQKQFLDFTTTIGQRLSTLDFGRKND